MNIKKFITIFTLILVLFSITALASAIPNSLWSYINAYSAAVSQGDNQKIFDIGSHMIAVMESQPDSQTKTEFLAGKYYQVADAAEKLGLYEQAVINYTKYIPYGTIMNQTDGILYAETKTKLLKSRFEVFCETPYTGRNGYYTGARLEPENGLLYGSVYDKDPAVGGYNPHLVERTYGKPTSLNLVYLGFGEDPSQLGRYEKYFNEIKSGGGAVMFAWNTSSPLGDIENYRSYVVDTINWLASWDMDIIVRFGNEMNVAPNGINPGDYIKSFRYVADIIHSTTDMAVCWAPNDVGGIGTSFDMYYPGDQYVDWVGVSLYMNRHFRGLNISDPIQQDISDSYFFCGDYTDPVLKLGEIVSFMQKNNIVKPIAITECGSPHTTNYTENCEAWGAVYLHRMYGELMRVYPQVKSICYFNVERPQETQHYSFYENTTIKNAYMSAIQEDMFLKSPDDVCNYVYSTVLPATPETETLNLSVSAYYPHVTDGIVVYLVDGVWYHETSTSPYKCTLDLSRLSEGPHTLTVKYCTKNGTQLMSKEHTFNVSRPIKVFIDGNQLSFSDCSPFVLNGRTLVPLRAIFEALGAEISWNDATQTVTSVKGDTTISFTIGSDIFTKNGVRTTLDVPPQLYSSRTVVPVRAVAESFGCNVDWDSSTNSVIIITK